MKVLQICNDFAGSKVHVSLVRKLDEKGVEQVVYCPVRDQKLIGVNRFEGTHVEFIYSYIINPCVSLCIVTTGVTLTVNSVQAASRHTGGST